MIKTVGELRAKLKEFPDDTELTANHWKVDMDILVWDVVKNWESEEQEDHKCLIYVR